MDLRYLSMGCKGSDVRNVQQLLNYHLPETFPPLKDDGIFGGKTDGRLREFQRLNGLDQDGVVGAETRKRLLQLIQVCGEIQVWRADRTIEAARQQTVPRFITNHGQRFHPCPGRSASSRLAATLLFPQPAVIDFGGQASFRGPPLSKASTKSNQLSLPSAGGDGIGFELDHELKLDLNILKRNDGNPDPWLDGKIKFFSGQPFNREWKFEAEVKADLFKSPRLGPFELSGFGKGSLDLAQPTVDVAAGGALKMSILRDKFGRDVIGLEVEVGAKLTLQVGERSVKLEFDTAGQFWLINARF